MRQVTATEKLRAVNEGKMAKTEFVRQMRQSYPMYISQYNQFDDTVQILKNRGMLFEEYKNPSKNLSDDSIRRGLDVELTTMGLDPVTCSDGEAIAKAKAKAIANIEKDPLHYYNLLSNESSKVDKNDQPKETKRGALEKDTFNDMKKATLKERKERLVEGTRALVGFLSGDRLTTTYNHYDGYPSGLGKGLMTHYNNDDLAKDIAMKGYITGMDPDTGEISQTHQDPPKKIVLDDDAEQRAREIAEEIDGMGADYGYIWDDESNQWITIKNTGIRSMIDQMIDKLSMMNVYSGDKMNEVPAVEEIDTSLDPLEDKKEIINQVIQLIKRSMPADNETIKSFIKTHYNDIINLGGDDNAILDEFQEFLSVNTDYVDEKKVTEDVKQTNFSTDEIKSVSFPNGLSVTVGQPHPEEEGIVNFIRKGQNGYEIGFVDGSEGGSYAVDFNGEFLDEDDYIEENKATKDHDGDGEVESKEDEYKGVKDKAIKKAMGKNVNEAVKNIITKVLEEKVLSEAATNDLAKIADEYGDFEGLKPAVIALENIVTEIESFYDKTRGKIQKIYNDLGEIKNEEGLKVGAFIAPSIENAFKRDLRPIIKNQFHGGLDMPKVKRISQADVDRGYIQQEAPKETVFTPVNENKKK